MSKVNLGTDPVVTGTLPLYGDIVPLQYERHRDWSLRGGSGAYAFAAKAPTIPIAVDEFERAALDYPLVFFGPGRAAFAVTGVESDRNAFVEASGSYAIGRYIPAYLRRHPFVFARDGSEDRRIVCLDESSDRLVAAPEDGASPLFVDGAPSEQAELAIGFCRAFEAAETRTRALTDLLEELDLFENRQATITRPSGAHGDPVRTHLLDYATVDRAKLAALDGEAISRLHAAAALGPIYALLLSGGQLGGSGPDRKSVV